MDSLSLRPAVSAPPPPLVQDKKPQAAQTDLPETATVTRTDNTLPARQKPEEKSPEPVARQNTSSSLDVDFDARLVIAKKTNTDTGEILEQYPNEASVSLRSYLREQADTPPVQDILA